MMIQITFIYMQFYSSEHRDSLSRIHLKTLFLFENMIRAGNTKQISYNKGDVSRIIPQDIY